MSDQSPYEQLGVSESASFDEIQAARNRLFETFKDSAEQRKQVEAAYDAVLMDRLKMRQEGRIKVPDVVRFAERRTEAPASTPNVTQRQTPAWLTQWLDTPSKADITLPAGVMAALSVLVFVMPTTVQLALILGVGSAFYFLYRKERKLGRAILLSFLGMTVGVLGGGLLYGLISQIPSLMIGTDVFASIITFVLLWLISSFLR